MNYIVPSSSCAALSQGRIESDPLILKELQHNAYLCYNRVRKLKVGCQMSFCTLILSFSFHMLSPTAYVSPQVSSQPLWVVPSLDQNPPFLMCSEELNQLKT